MKDIVREYQEQFRRHRIQLRRYTALLLALAMVTTLFVNWQLHSDGIAKTADYLCNREEHTHTAECYPQVLICGYEEGEPEDWTISQPDEGAIIDEGFGVDPEPETAQQSAEPEYIWVPHEHTDECYAEVTTEVPVLTCMEEEHVHTDDCFDPEDNTLICGEYKHTHDESCYTIEYETEVQLVCGHEEGDLVEELNPDYSPVAMFEAPVAEARPVVIAPVAEGPVHHHTDACYAPDYTAEPICGKEEHHHDVNCLSDPLDGLEDESDWLDQTGTALTGLWNEDLLTVAQGQLGYEQSEKNFKLDTDDGETLRYYTRYGAWYGNSYGAEWDVMFLSYCLNHAGIPQSAIPQESGTMALHSQLRGTGYMGDFSGDMPIDAVMPGDIVFYTATSTKAVVVEDSQPAVSDDSPEADIALLSMDEAVAASEAPQIEEVPFTDTTVGIVSDVDPDAGTLTVISGNVDGKVAEVTLTASQVTSLVSVATAQALNEDGADTLEENPGLNAKDYVTKFKIVKETSSGRYEESDTVLITDKVMGRIELDKIPAQSIVDNDYKIYVDLPEGLDCHDITGSLDGNAGSYHFIQKDDHWVLVLEYDKNFIDEQNISSDSLVSSWVQFRFQWDETQIDKNGENNFEINDSGKVTITINDKKQPDSKDDVFSLKKSASKLRYDDSKNAYIDYTVTLTVNSEMDAPFTINDMLQQSGGAAFTYTDETPTITASNGSAPEINWSGINGSKDIVLGVEGGKIPAGTYTITYHIKCPNFTNATLEEDAKVNNRISATYHGEDHNTSSETKFSNTPISKSGSLKDGYITWIVTLNKPNDKNAMAYLKDAYFTDTLPDDLVDQQITVKKDGGKKEKVALNSSNYDSASRKINYKLDDGYHWYEITYKTKAPDTGLTDVEVFNTGTIKGDGIDDSNTGKVIVSSETLKKTLDSSSNVGGTASMSWTTTIDAEDLSQYVYYDWSGILYVDGTAVKAQELVEGSVTVTTAKDGDVTNKVKIDSTYSHKDANNPDLEVGLFSIDFSGAGITGPATITYKTTSDTSRLPAGSAWTITNYGQLNDGKVVSASYRFTNTDDQWQYFYKYGGNYDWNSVMAGQGSITLQPGETLPWTIVLNDKDVLTKKNYNTWTVTDIIPEGLILNENSIRITSYGEYVAAEGTDYTYTVESKQVDGRNCTVLTITLNQSCIMAGENKPRTHIEIYYDTSLDPKSSVWNGEDAIDFTNHATFTCDDEKKGDTKFTETVTRNILGKEGTFDDSTGTLTYNVMVNPYGIQLLESPDGELLLWDQLNLPDALTASKNAAKGYVTLEGITVYNGEFINGEFVPTTWIRDLYPVSGSYDNNAFKDSSTAPVSQETYYSKDNSNFSNIQAWTKVPDATPLVLVFHYTVDMPILSVGTPLDFTNTVQLNNQDKWSYKDISLKTTYDSSGGADIFNKDRLTIFKYGETRNEPLEGATFTLERYDETSGWQEVLVKNKPTFKTNQSGNFVLGVDRNTLYRLKEIAPPEGHLLPESNDYYYFYISKDSDYMPPTGSGAADVHVYRLTVAGSNFQNFYYDVQNARNPEYVKYGDLLVKKAWKNHDGSELTDESKMPVVTVKLTKHVANPGHRILLQWDGQDTIIFAKDINNGGSVLLTTGAGFFDAWSSSLPEGVTITNTEKFTSDWTPIYKISNITSDIVIKNQTIYYNRGSCENVNDDGTPITDTTDTVIGTVKLNASNNWISHFENLEIDDGITYTIKEVSVDGYTTSYTLNGADLAVGQAFELGTNSGNGDTIVITNTADETGGYELPSTGGAGTTPYTAVGGAIALAALVCGLCQKRRRERRAHN